ncbi:hypothetical protein [Pseudomonas peli]|uniref:hypothetical protein n=1 Tax=Pseudomonas peli TaxID=592361 RepID=UPI003D32104A
MHKLGYAHAIATSSALILAALLSSNVSAEVFAPEVFSHAPLHTTTAEPAQNSNLHNARLQPEKNNTELASSAAPLNSRWISLPAKAPQLEQPPPPGLRF